MTRLLAASLVPPEPFAGYMNPTDERKGALRRVLTPFGALEENKVTDSFFCDQTKPNAVQTERVNRGRE
jgi:hypothetical protein